MTCPTCLRPRATDEDARTWAASSDGTDTPDGWPDPDGSHLCWAEIADGECEPPDWFAAVTPLEVREMRAMVAETRGALDEPDRYPDHPVGALAIELREARDEVRLLRATIAAMTPRWRTGEPPAGSWVWREGEHLPCRTLTDAEFQSDGDPDRLLYRPAGTVIPYPWGTARWCPINKPEKT